MSAWVCSKAHIDAMVSAGIALGGGSSEPYGYVYWALEAERAERIDLSPANADLVGGLLRDTIVQGVSHRYPGDDVSKGELPGPTDGWYLKPYKHEETRALADGEIVALIGCYEYQASEHNDWTNTFGWKFCEHVKHMLLKRVQQKFEALGGKTEWGYEDEHVFPGFEQYAVELRALEFPLHVAGPLVLVSGRSPEEARERAAKWHDAEAVAATLHSGELTPEQIAAAAKRNAEWVTEQSKPAPAPEPAPEFRAPDTLPADLAALLNRAAKDNDGPSIRNS